MKKARNPIKPFIGWAHVGPDNRIVTICKAPQIYGTKKDVLLDMNAEYGDRPVKIEIRELRRGGRK